MRHFILVAALEFGLVAMGRIESSLATEPQVIDAALDRAVLPEAAKIERLLTATLLKDKVRAYQVPKDLERAKAMHGKLPRTGPPDHDKRNKMAQGLLKAQKRKGLATAPVTTFKDCGVCPGMILIPAGEFVMGSPVSDEYRDSDEGPQHSVTIPRAFAIGKYEVTFAEWDACVVDGGCNGHQPKDEGWGRGSRPVINVSWDDAEAFVEWLSRKTGKQYRLPSEAEWEYAARAGTTTPFHTGSTISTDQANFRGTSNYRRRPKGVFRKKTVQVGSFPPNAFGVHDMHGNVFEWVKDCLHVSYAGAPADGVAWTAGGQCEKRVLRGGSWCDDPWTLRSAFRYYLDTYFRDYDFGFRVARTLD